MKPVIPWKVRLRLWWFRLTLREGVYALRRREHGKDLFLGYCSTTGSVIWLPGGDKQIELFPSKYMALAEMETLYGRKLYPMKVSL